MINRVILVGRLTRDPELRKANSGLPVASFSIAVDNRMKNPDGSRGTTFMNCSIFGNQAENVVKFTRKGSMVGVEGSLNQRNFTRQDGSKGSVIEVIADRVAFLEPKSSNRVVEGETVTFDDTPVQESGNNLDSLDLPDDDLPF
jgi:single-strand DNA-binding protein